MQVRKSIVRAFLALGVVLGAWIAVTQVAIPLVGFGVFLLRDPQLEATRLRALATTAGILLAVVLFVGVVPMPLYTVAQGVTWLPEESHVRAGAGGFVRRVLAEPDALVRSGDPLLELHDPELWTRIKLLEAELQELQTRYWAVRYSDRYQSELIVEELTRTQKNLEVERERQAEMMVRSPTNGRFVLPHAHALVDRYYEQGELVGYVTQSSGLIVRVVVPQADAALVRVHTEAVEVRLAERIGDSIAARIEREVPAATNELPSRALSREGGGSFHIDPEDPLGTRAIETVFQFDLTLPAELELSRVGERVHVRFDHGSEPLVRRSYRALRRLFLERFDV